ncbi:uncharacterized protein LOC117318911, partial [Pecten maximus]|uniref:uncharacterized protein LOC117318911 n=1 Tax=Pecten maximus TaxID=6579 RepID=UPI0014590E2D
MAAVANSTTLLATEYACYNTMHASVDQGSQQMSFKIPQDIDLKTGEFGKAKEMAISTHKRIYETQEESEAAFIYCNVNPVPNSIEWKRDKMPPPMTRVVVDNRKYFYSVEAPTLVIRNPNKPMDEGHYQCTAEANGKSVDGDIVELQVFPVETGVSRANTNIPSHSSVTERKLTQQTQ